MINEKETKYKVILDNLLEINQSDSSIFTKINNNKKCFDLYSLLGPEMFREICDQETFSINVFDYISNSLIDSLKKSNIPSDFINTLNKVKHLEIKYSENKLFKEFEKSKKEIIENLESQLQKWVVKWKLLNDAAAHILDQNNIWPLHIGFLFVSVRIDDKFVYAPLFFKEVILTFRNGTPILSSSGHIKVNEKLLFFLNNNEFNLQIDSDFKELKIESLISKIKKDWKGIYEVPENIIYPFKELELSEINNKSLIFHPGAVLGLFEPWGGYSRTRMKEIIQNNEMDQILKVEFNKNIYKERVDKTIFNPNISLFKITPTNYSQDKAILSSLNQNTVIWGPPGTGKSQTIVNLIANILVYDKTAIVASQKKAALEVIKERMGLLSKFCLFVLNSKEMNKQSFYQPIQEYLDFLENFAPNSRFKLQETLTNEEQKFVQVSSELTSNKNTPHLLESYYYFSAHKPDFQLQKDVNFIATIPSYLNLPDGTFNGENTKKKLLRKSKLRFMPFLPKYQEIASWANKIDQNLKTFNGDLFELRDSFKFFDFENPESEFIKLKQKIEVSNELQDQIKRKSIISDEKMIQDIIAQRIFQRVNNLNEEEKKEYFEFASSVRIMNLEPYRFVKKFTNIIKKIFPIVIATPNTDLSGWSKHEFDYAILDESSQIFIENGLPILYLAKKKILAGDTKQMRPSNWFGTRTIDDSIFGKVESLLDYALSIGTYQILLDKNYRSNHASLMSFSSKYFYNSSLDVLDVAFKNSDDAIELIQVDGIWKDNRNIAEAKKCIELLIANLHKYKKIILLAFNAKQSEYLKNVIYTKFPELEEAVTNKKILIRNIENIQGDEADLIIATVAYDKNTRLQFSYVAREGGKNALNIAISRAKEKMIVIKTLKSSEILINDKSTDDLRIFKKWLGYIEMNQEAKNLILKENNSLKQAISNELKTNQFKEFIYEKLASKIKINKNLTISKDVKLGTIEIDFVIKFKNKPYKYIVVDNLDYKNNVENYVLKKDFVSFLESKKYSPIVINPINWIWVQNQIDKDFYYENLDKFEHKK